MAGDASTCRATRGHDYLDAVDVIVAAICIYHINIIDHDWASHPKTCIQLPAFELAHHKFLARSATRGSVGGVAVYPIMCMFVSVYFVYG